MWGKRRKRRSPLSRQLAHALLQDAMARAQQRKDEDEADEPAVPEVPAPRAGESARHGSFGRKNP